MSPPRCLPLGESAFTLVFGDTIDPVLHRRVMAVARRLEAEPPRGVVEVVPAYTTVTVWFDPLEREAADLSAELLELSASDQQTDGPTDRLTRRQHTIPVRYNGPDLAEVAAATGLSVAEVIRRHSTVEYRVFLLGFVPGFAFLGTLDPALVLPRRSTPRQRVPAGSVGIAGVQTAVYPLETPGGWHLIGHTDLSLWNPRRAPPALLSVGDTVRFEPVT